MGHLFSLLIHLLSGQFNQSPGESLDQIRKTEAKRHLARAQELVRQKIYSKADVEIGAAFRLDPACLQSAFAKKGELQAAFEDFRHAYFIEPDNSNIRLVYEFLLRAVNST